ARPASSGYAAVAPRRRSYKCARDAPRAETSSEWLIASAAVGATLPPIRSESRKVQRWLVFSKI
ncbi:MAG TPA: hypothetical protein VFM56_15880, partial [Solimonas sp.]|nr:hypothetical protein [Solimonas sp.]